MFPFCSKNLDDSVGGVLKWDEYEAQQKEKEEKKRQKATVRTATVRTAPERERREEEDEDNSGPTMNDISDPPCYDMVRKDDQEVEDDLEIQEL